MTTPRTPYRGAILALWLLAGCATAPLTAPLPSPLQRAVNLGNTLEQLPGEPAQLHMKEEYFPIIQEAGFDSLRVPVKWSASAETAPPYTLNAEILQQTDRIITHALANGLAVILDFHHYHELMDAPADHTQRYLAIWEQIAAHYQNAPPALSFELLNEPTGALDSPTWNRILNSAVETIRKTNPERTIIIGPVFWNNLTALDTLALPQDDDNIIVTFHYYAPLEFTHQGASWVPGSRRWMGTTWLGTRQEKRTIRRDFNRAARWAKRHHRPLLLGEFGSYQKAGHPSRIRWTRFVVQEAEKRNISWAYWEFYSGFGIYNPHQNQWRNDLLRALIPTSSALP